MAANAELYRIFLEISKALELQGANPFRVGAYSRAARVMGDLNFDVATIADDHKKLTAIEGIGDGTAKKIAEFVETGHVAEHDKLLAEVPRGLFDVMKIPGLGPKTVKLMWEQAGVVDLESLKRALDSGELEELPRLGKKSVEKIRAALAFLGRAAERTRLGEALPLAEQIVATLRKVKGAKAVEYAGSLRRGRETIGDIDIVAATTRPGALAEAFRALPNVAEVIASGETKTSVRLADGLQSDLRIVPEESFGAAWLYFTGSKEHNIILRERALKRKLRLNEYGLFPDDARADESPQERGVEPVAGSTEEQIYAALDLPWFPPELREEFLDLKKPVPDLIDVDDIKAELHAHTIASDGRFTIEELAREAKRRGFHTVAVTDHSKSSIQANGLPPERLREHIAAVRAAKDSVKGITILAGAEVDILTDGLLDYEDDLLAELDIVVASPHAALTQDREKSTARLLAAIRHPLVHILGHPTGRVIGRRDGLSPDIEAVVAAAVQHNVALEINANYLRLDLRDIHVRAAVEAGALLAINTDAHTEADFDHLRYGILTARRGGLTAAHCINTWPKTKLRKWLREKRKG